MYFGQCLKYSEPIRIGRSTNVFSCRCSSWKALSCCEASRMWPGTFDRPDGHRSHPIRRRPRVDSSARPRFVCRTRATAGSSVLGTCSTTVYEFVVHDLHDVMLPITVGEKIWEPAVAMVAETGNAKQSNRERRYETMKNGCMNCVRFGDWYPFREREPCFFIFRRTARR